MQYIKFVGDRGSMMSCGMLRGVIPAACLNASPKWRVDVKQRDDLYFSDYVNTAGVIFQRLFDPATAELTRELRTKGIRVALDIDDALWLLPKSLSDPEHKLFDIVFPEDACKALFKFAEEEVDCVTCSTPELAAALQSVCPKAHLNIVPNFVDECLFRKIGKPESEKNWFDVAWYAANGHNHQATFLHDVLTKCLNDPEMSNMRVHLVGCASSFLKLKELSMIYGNRIVHHQWVNYTKLGLFLNQFDAVLCPIVEHPFTICKSEIKALESASCGVLPIMSDVPQYKRFASKVLTEEEKALLLLPNDIKQWADTLKKLHNDRTTVPTLKSLPVRVRAEYGMVRAMEAWGGFLHFLLNSEFFGTPFGVLR